jgi:hypothetical protein
MVPILLAGLIIAAITLQAKWRKNISYKTL